MLGKGASLPSSSVLSLRLVWCGCWAVQRAFPLLPAHRAVSRLGLSGMWVMEIFPHRRKSSFVPAETLESGSVLVSPAWSSCQTDAVFSSPWGPCVCSALLWDRKPTDTQERCPRIQTKPPGMPDPHNLAQSPGKLG